ncbi:MAG: hypothetical protein KIT83_06245 [Bryobacterales bacterium]|nr:hypothetical protein [Bryobacterales bacterium]
MEHVTEVGMKSRAKKNAKKIATDRDLEDLAQEAKSIVVYAFRNGAIEDIHAGKACPRCSGKSEYSHITQEEMRILIKSAVDRIYALLKMKSEYPEHYDEMIKAGALFTAAWDDPEDNVSF